MNDFQGASDMAIVHDLLHEREQYHLHMLDALPVAIYTTDAAGKITYYNQAAADFAGRHPQLGSDEWCVTWRLYRPDGTPLPHDECPMALTLKERPANTRAGSHRRAARRHPHSVHALSHTTF